MKSMLVIDSPDKCCNCPLCIGFMCAPLNKEILMGEMLIGRQYECPLKPMPERKEERLVNLQFSKVFWAEGWNACLEEIEK